MSEIQNASFIVKDASGNIAVVSGLSAADIQKLNGVIADVTALKTSVEELFTGSRRIATTDLTQEDNQSSMREGVYYLVPFDSSDTFVEFENGKPTGGKTVDHFTVMFKAEEGVQNLGNIDMMPKSFDDFATLSGTQTFSGVVTFTQTPQISATQELSSIGDNDAVKGAVVKALNTSINGKVSVQVADARPGSNDDVPVNTLVAYPSANLLTA